MAVRSRHDCATSSRLGSVSTVFPPMTTTVIVSPVTPAEVVPPLSAPWGSGRTQGGAYFSGTLMRPVAGSQRGDANASLVPTPAPSDAARTTPAGDGWAARRGVVVALLMARGAPDDAAVFAAGPEAVAASVGVVSAEPAVPPSPGATVATFPTGAPFDPAAVRWWRPPVVRVGTRAITASTRTTVTKGR